MSTARRVVVVGGGIIGAACAYYLSRSGWQVTIVDQGGFGRGCSHANCGFVCPSHVLPLAAPGAVWNALRSLVQPNSPFRVKPRLDLRLLGWMFRFARRCNHHDMLDSGRAIQALLNSSRQLYDELLKTEAIECEWEPRGLLFVFQSPKAFEHYAETDRLLRETFNLGADRHDGPALSALEPALKPGLAGGWHYRTDAHLRPDRLLTSWRQVLERQGVNLREQCAMKGLRTVGDRATAVLTDKGELEAEEIVIATGAWTPLLERQLGCRIPVQPGKGYSITMPRPALCPALPLIFEEHRVAVTPMQSGYRIGSMMEFAGYDASVDRRRLEILRSGAAHYLREPVSEPVQEEWFGWRPMTPDGKPILDRTPALKNVMLAVGHNMLGLSMAPATGKLVAEALEGRDTHIDLAPYSLKRF